MPVWMDATETQLTFLDDDSSLVEVESAPMPAICPRAVHSPAETEPDRSPVVVARPPTVAPYADLPLLAPGEHRWAVPSSLSLNPEEARGRIPLPEFDDLLLEKARVISGRFPFAEAEYRNSRGTEPHGTHPEIPHFERVFRIAATLASVHKVQEARDYDALLILTAWHSVRPG